MEEKSNLYIVAIVGIVAIVALIILVTGGRVNTAEDAAGQAMAKECYMYSCKCGPYSFGVSDGSGCPSSNDGYSCTETKYKVRCSD